MSFSVIFNDVWFDRQIERLPLRSLLPWNHLVPDDERAGGPIWLPPRWRTGEPLNLRNLQRILPESYLDRYLHFVALYQDMIGRILPGALELVRCHLDFEWILYSEAGHVAYRDHFIHPFRVAFLGDWLLRCRWDATSGSWNEPVSGDEDPYGPGTLCALLVDRLRSSDATKNLAAIVEKNAGPDPDTLTRTFLSAWWIAALTHDFGYTLALVLERLEPQLTGAYPWLGPRPLTCLRYFFDRFEPRPADPAVDEPAYLLTKRVVELFPSGKDDLPAVLESLMRTRWLHGVHGAVNLLAWLEEVNRRAAVLPPFWVAVSLASCAAFEHDLLSTAKGRDQTHGHRSPSLESRLASGRESWLEDHLGLRPQGKAMVHREFLDRHVGRGKPLYDPERYPLSWLLGLCDLLQDWGRSRLCQTTDLDTASRDRLCLEFIVSTDRVSLDCGPSKKKGGPPRWTVGLGDQKDKTGEKTAAPLLSQLAP